jgi:LmbE family N-acetylglucosaminyl deacetylase
LNLRSRISSAVNRTVLGDLLTRAAEWWYGSRYPQALHGRCNVAVRSEPKGGVLVVAAHPDDEVLGNGLTMIKHRARGERVVVVFATNGAGGNWRDGIGAGSGLAARRFSEACAALGEIGIPAQDVVCLGFPDGGLQRYVREAARDIERLLLDCAPRVVYVHALEGGHLDHDMTSYIVQSLCARQGLRNVYEWCEYNRDAPLGQSPREARFAADPYLPNFERRMMESTDEERQIKLRMLTHYASQAGIIAQYPFQSEGLRAAVAGRLRDRLRYFSGLSRLRLALVCGRVRPAR